jgi:hypothetical protein
MRLTTAEKLAAEKIQVGHKQQWRAARLASAVHDPLLQGRARPD